MSLSPNDRATGESDLQRRNPSTGIPKEDPTLVVVKRHQVEPPGREEMDALFSAVWIRASREDHENSHVWRSERARIGIGFSLAAFVGVLLVGVGMQLTTSDPKTGIHSTVFSGDTLILTEIPERRAVPTPIPNPVATIETADEKDHLIEQLASQTVSLTPTFVGIGPQSGSKADLRYTLQQTPAIW